MAMRRLQTMSGSRVIPTVLADGLTAFIRIWTRRLRRTEAVSESSPAVRLRENPVPAFRFRRTWCAFASSSITDGKAIFAKSPKCPVYRPAPFHDRWHPRPGILSRLTALRRLDLRPDPFAQDLPLGGDFCKPLGLGEPFGRRIEIGVLAHGDIEQLERAGVGSGEHGGARDRSAHVRPQQVVDPAVRGVLIL